MSAKLTAMDQVLPINTTVRQRGQHVGITVSMSKETSRYQAITKDEKAAEPGPLWTVCMWSHAYVRRTGVQHLTVTHTACSSL